LRWVVLAAGTTAQSSQAAAFGGLAVLAPALRDRYGLSLTQVGVMLALSGVGATLTLLPWGMAADRVGDRVTGSVGLLGAGVGLAVAGHAAGFAGLVVALTLAGAFGASINTASGRVVTSWFPREQRGLALGIRQTSVPIGGFAAALAVPAIADHSGTKAAFLALAAFSLLGAVLAAALFVEGPVRSAGEDETDLLRHPVRDPRIWRLSFGSSALIFTQVVVTGFIVLYLESQRDFSATEAGLVLALINVVGAAGRLWSGRASDRRGGGRVALIRAIAVGAAVALFAAVALARTSSWLLVPVVALGGGLAMSWNGLAVAATVETAGPTRRGAALGLQQTVIGVAVVLAPLLFAQLVDATSWRAGFALAAAAPLVAVLILRPLRV
jgi:sugar phosphate permease